MVRHLELTPLYPRTLGFDRLFEQIEKVFDAAETASVDKFPPHNIVKLNDTQYVVELAIAGFSKKDITIVDNLLPFEEIFIGSNHFNSK